MKSAMKVLKDIFITFSVLVTITVLVLVGTHYGAFQKLVRTAYLIDKVYLWDTDRDQLVEGAVDGAVDGMLSSLGDKYTAYIAPKSTARLMQQVSGNVYGIGVYISENDENQLIFVGTIPEGPAEAAGILPGDRLIGIDEEDVTGLSVDEATAILRGSGPTEVTVTVLRGEEELSYTLTRYKIGTVKTVDGDLLPDNPDILYVRVNSISAQSATEFAKKVNEFRDPGYSGMILDLRDNGGGEVNAAINMARIFVDGGPIVHIEQGNGKRITRSADTAQLHVPLVVLVNENTASAAEILSAALKENDRATLVGTKTFGKGLVQGIYFYKDGSAAKITEARYLTPKQNDINGIGIQPNIVVEQPANGEDLQLIKAVEVLRKQIKAGAVNAGTDNT